MKRGRTHIQVDDLFDDDEFEEISDFSNVSFDDEDDEDKEESDEEVEALFEAQEKPSVKKSKSASKPKKGKPAKAKKIIDKAKPSVKKGQYKRGELITRLYEMFDKVGVDNVKYDEAEKLAKKIKKDTKFNKYHLSWYKNDYKNKRDLP